MKTLANKITVFRVFLVPVFMVFAYLGLRWFSLAAFVIASVSDAFDGFIARKLNQVSNFGKFLDPLADKMIVVAALCFLTDCNQFRGWILSIIIIREFAVSALRLIASEKGVVIAAKTSGKVKTAVSMVCIAAMLVFPNIKVISIISEYLILIVTVISGIDLFVSDYHVLKS